MVGAGWGGWGKKKGVESGKDFAIDLHEENRSAADVMCWHGQSWNSHDRSTAGSAPSTVVHRAAGVGVRYSSPRAA